MYQEKGDALHLFQLDSISRKRIYLNGKLKIINISREKDKRKTFKVNNQEKVKHK